ncbi:MAG: response regulator [Micavibrio aeruginosavorus]|uniref:Response regulator n=1 Tax=Micavibrio aeruginosavorus TaxID=349221 RepID=A0A7T5R113_9BACT|nr:MAG: response regulator [Micavibrio aeruginosavorus]
MDDMPIEYQQAFNRLKRTYIQRLDNTIRIIDNILDLEQYNPPTREDLLRAQALVHGLCGSGTTFGFPEITEAARDADHFLDSLIKRMQPGEALNQEMDRQYDAVMIKVQDVCRGVCRQTRLETPEFANMNIYDMPGKDGQPHILIVEDDTHVASVLANNLRAQGYTVQVSANAEDALHYLARVRPDLVIVDMVLKGMDGIELLYQIKQNSEHLDIPVLMMSTRNRNEEDLRCMRAGAEAFVQKPVDLEAMNVTIKDILASHAVSLASSST